MEAYIDPLDTKGQYKKYILTEEIESEKQKIKCKYLFKYGRQESDPFKLWSWIYNLFNIIMDEGEYRQKTYIWSGGRYVDRAVWHVNIR